MKREKENSVEVMEWRMRCKEDRKLLAQELTLEDRPFFDESDEEFDESNISDFVRNGCSFKEHDLTNDSM